MDWNGSNEFRNIKEQETKAMMDMHALVPQNIEPISVALVSSEKVNAVATKPKRKSMTSLYLKFFETAADGKSRRCKFCKQNYSMATATGNLGRHLNHRHPGYDREEGEAVMSQVLQPPVSSIVSKKSQYVAKAPPVDFDQINWLLIKWLIEGSLSLSIFKDEGLSNCFKILNPSVNFWSKDRAHAVILEVFRSMREDVRTFIEQANSKISIALDFWTSYEEVCYMSVTGHWIDENWALHKVLLDISHIPYGGAEIYQMLLKVLRLFNIDNRILCCAHDSSQTAVKACHKLKEYLDGRKVPFFFIPCAAQTLNLIIEDGLRTAKPLISKIREFVLEMNSSLEIAQDFVQISTAYQEGSWEIPLDASTRWSGEYTILDIVRKSYGALEAVIQKHEENLGARNMLLNPAERNAINIMHAFLEPFYKITTDLCTSKSLTIGLVLFFMDHIIEMIGACRDGHGNPDWLKSTADDMSKKAQCYSCQVHNMHTYIAAVLDPRIKGELLSESINTENNLEDARNHFARNYPTHFPVLANGYSGAQESEEGGSVSFAEEIARKRRRVSVSTPTDELTQYLSEPPAPLLTDVLDWWKGNCIRYPRLSVMARDYLAVQPTSVAPNDLFSSKGDEVDKQRIRLPHSNAQAVLCIRSWTQSGFKFKFRSTDIDFDKLLESVSATPYKH